MLSLLLKACAHNALLRDENKPCKKCHILKGQYFGGRFYFYSLVNYWQISLEIPKMQQAMIYGNKYQKSGHLSFWEMFFAY